MTDGPDESPIRKRTSWPTRLVFIGVAFVLTYPLVWPWMYVVGFKLEELLGRDFGNRPIIVAVFTAFSTPLSWLLQSSPHLVQIYTPYVRFVFDLFGVNFG